MDPLTATPHIVPSLATRIESIEGLPVLSEQHQRLRALVRSIDATLDEVVELVEQDPAFAANLVRIANSAIYGQRYPANSIRRAVQVLGFRGVGHMSLTLEIVQGFGFPAGVDHGLFWDHALNVAAAAKDIAYINGIDGDQAYLVGLLHDLSFIVLAKFLPDVFATLLQRTEQEGQSIHVACKEVFDCTPYDLTAHVMRRWRFAEGIYGAVSSILDHGAPVSAEIKKVALAVRNAHALVEANGPRGLPGDFLPPLEDAERLSLGKYEFRYIEGIGAAVLSCC